MKHLGAVVASLLLLIAFGSLCRAEGPSSPPDPERQLWEREMELGESALAEGDYSEALSHFLTADAVELFEVPNYEALPRIAEVRCHLGDLATGQAIVADMRCILDVDLGILPCYVGEATQGAPGHPNPALTPVCFDRMCSEIFLGYYDSPSDLLRARIEKLRLELDRVDEICGKAREK